MRLLIFGLLIAVTSSQSSTMLCPIGAILGLSRTPAPVTGPITQRLEDIKVKPSEKPLTHVNNSRQTCLCVPYYLCDYSKIVNVTCIGADANNISVIGWSVLDTSCSGFGDGPLCTKSNEVCCILPPDLDFNGPKPTPKTKPQPDSAKLKGCGYRNPNGIGTFFNGSTTQFGEYPWVVAISDAYNSSYVGVGVLINPEVVMTVAHVAYKYGPGSLKIRAGEWDIKTEKEVFDFQERSVQDMYIHQEFRHTNLKNDIALLRLERPLELAEHINVICMPEQDEVFDSHKNCVANGWGKDTFGVEGQYAVILKKVEVDMVPHSRCNLLLKKTRLGSNFKLHDSFLCAGGEEGKDTCQGDGGAPLACPMGNNRYKLTGLVSWGIGCGQKDVPAVYTNVPKYRDWVDDKMVDWGLQTTSSE